MQKLIEDLLTFSRVATHGRSFAPVDLVQLTAEVLEDLETAVEQSGAAVLVGALPTIYADELQMRQLIQNLLTNALKFRREATPPEISIDGVVRNGTAEITVRDNGIGFDPQYRDRIFRLFDSSMAVLNTTEPGLASRCAARSQSATAGQSLPTASPRSARPSP
jgi:light-regulated signal transduction histidine kinase (bacteriophytochrome)